MRAILLTILLLFHTLNSWAASTSINTVGSDDGIAISGYDVVAFHVLKKAMPGSPEFSHSHQGATWTFATEQNLKMFQDAPEKYAPAWGGHCAWAVSENLISSKKLSGDFEVIDGRLYLFSFGSDSKIGAKDAFAYGRPGRYLRIKDGDKYWPDISQKLEDGRWKQRKASNFQRSRFE